MSTTQAQSPPSSGELRAGHRLSGVGLAGMRAAWLAVSSIHVVLFALAVPISFGTEEWIGGTKYFVTLAELGLEPIHYAAYITFLHTILACAFAVFGALIFLRKSDDGFVALVSLACVTAGAYFVPELTRLAAAQPSLALATAALRALGLGLALIVFYYLMPDGRLVPRWTLWPALVWVGLVMVWLLYPQSPANLVSFETWGRDRAFATLLYLLFFGSGIYSQVYRYRCVSGAVERQQMKWVVLGVTAAIVGFAIYYVPLSVSPAFADGTMARLVHLLLATPVFMLAVIAAPAAIAVAILRFRLWDVDALISRTLVYGTLTLALGAVYFGAVVMLQQVFIAFTGERSDLALVASTLSIAAIFDPLRQNLQRWVDRRFYRRRYDAMQVLLSVGDTVREEVDLDRLTARLMSAVDEAMQPTRSAIWLAAPDTASEPEEEQQMAPSGVTAGSRSA